MFTRARQALACLSLLMLTNATWAMSFQLIGGTLVLSGPVVADDLARMKDQLSGGKVSLVLLHESMGGDLWNGLQLSQRIRAMGLPTAVSGRCLSACGLIFLGGVERSFSDGRPPRETMIGLHGASHIETRQPMPEMGARMAHLIASMTGGKYPADLLDRTVYMTNPDDFIFVFHSRRMQREPTPRGVVECRNGQDAKLNCHPITGHDAMSIGVVTKAEMTVLDPAVKQYLSAP